MTGGGTQVAGRAWEAAAADFLLEQGLAIIARGYRCRLGELDIVCLDQQTLVIVEVRARASTGRGTAVETVTAHKQRKIVNATRHFLMRNPRWFDRTLRFDVIAIDGIETDEPRLSWVKRAFDAS
ncbi:MAG TPA: YraN family protein [Gammaproteobacteria bacterium]